VDEWRKNSFFNLLLISGFIFALEPLLFDILGFESEAPAAFAAGA
jgi:hypothetical protein